MSISGGRSAVLQVGYWSALLTATAAVACLALGVTTPPRSGPYCRGDCVTYPYTDAAAFVPRDYLWMYPALLLALVFVVLAVSIHDSVPRGRRVFSRIGVCFAVIGAGVLVVDYAIQLTVMQPALLSGETAGLSPLSQYNPHGVFIGLENIGYATLNLAFIFIGAALLAERSGLVRATGWIFAVGGVLTMILLIVYSAIYRASLDYRFEVLAILITWLVQIVGGVFVGVAFALRRSEERVG